MKQRLALPVVGTYTLSCGYVHNTLILSVPRKRKSGNGHVKRCTTNCRLEEKRRERGVDRGGPEYYGDENR